MSTAEPSSHALLACQVREQFAAVIEASLGPLADALRERLFDAIDRAESTRQAHERRDAALEFERLRADWVGSVGKALQRRIQNVGVAAVPTPQGQRLELIGDDVVEKKIIASRLAMALQEKSTWEFNELKVRMKVVDGGQELSADDLLQPDALAMLVIEQWMDSGLPRQSWLLTGDLAQLQLAPAIIEGYRAVNKALIARGIVPHIDMTHRVRRGAAPAAARRGGGGGAKAEGSAGGADGGGGYGGGSSSGGSGAASSNWNSAPSGSDGGGWQSGGGSGTSGASGASGAPSTSPLGRAKARAQGLVGQLRKLLTDRVDGFDPSQPIAASMALKDAVSRQASHFQTQVESRAAQVTGESFFFDNAAVGDVARDLRERTTELKRQASTSSEKAVIEIVALMFQSILGEERIPPAVRVWFARLQMPVLRLALAEPEFFGSLQHPARQLIDRMGACVLGFDATSIGGSALETEIRRLVQMIEQYPEAGRKAFLLAYDEFQKFLSRYLTETGTTRRVVSVAQQVEQKETMAVRYTIEMRKLLEDMPVRDEIRQFLFKVWAEVLAVAAVKHGPQHEETLALKKSASELVWSASAKPNRTERAQVIQGLPALLQRLRQGMTLMGIDGVAQEAHIKAIGDTLADAFQSKTAAIPVARIEAIAHRLANIEDFVGDDPEGDLPLVAESIEMMLGVDAADIEVITDGGSAPNAAMQAWARELQPGTWFRLDHNGQVVQVQYAWRSERGQLHLFASGAGRSYLIQAGRLAAYLQAGLIQPTEEEALTVRATRDALAKLDANPERLLS